MAITVKWAVFGGLKGGSPTGGEGGDVAGKLQNAINQNFKSVPITVATLGDPAPDVPKHFAAIVQNDQFPGVNLYYACQENQTINFEWSWAPPNQIKVKQAVFGALKGGDPLADRAADVAGMLQALINYSNDGSVLISHETLGDPDPGELKHFAATVERGGKDYYYACQEGQTINFKKGGD
jgi:hypothetical protein